MASGAGNARQSVQSRGELSHWAIVDPEVTCSAVAIVLARSAEDAQRHLSSQMWASYWTVRPATLAEVVEWVA